MYFLLSVAVEIVEAPEVAHTVEVMSTDELSPVYTGCAITSIEVSLPEPLTDSLSSLMRSDPVSECRSLYGCSSPHLVIDEDRTSDMDCELKNQGKS